MGSQEALDRLAAPLDLADFENWPEENKKAYLQAKERLHDSDAAFDALDSIETRISDALDDLRSVNTGTTRHRHLSLAVTHIEDALFRIKSVEYAISPTEDAERLNNG